jgi:hypothetical protein
MFRRLSIPVMTVMIGTALWAGGFWLEFGNANSEAKAHNAVLVVRPTGCGEPSKAAISGTAEGLVNGERQSVPLQLIRLSQPGMYAVKQTWPNEGSWVLALEGAYEGRVTSGIAPIGPAGLDRKSAKFFSHKPSKEDIDSVLQAFAGKPTTD